MRMLLALLFWVLTYPSLATIQPRVEQGVIDLSQYNFEKNGLVTLDGSWRFFWQGEFDKSSQVVNGAQFEQFIEVPRSWHRQQKVDGSGKFPVPGRGIYQIKIIQK